MLSDEERKAIENLKIEYEKLMKEDNILFPLYKSNAKRLIDIIEKQSKEIEDNKKYIDLHYVPYEQYVSKLNELNKKWKDKIKAKIEEYKEKCKNCNFRGKICKEFKQNYNCTIAMCLKEFYSLLEKE